jgi:inosine/xanthosine triphosphatase
MDHMKVVVASFNPVKLNAAEQAFQRQFPGQSVEVVPMAVGSGVADQPLTDEETRQGARTRAAAARDQAPDADYWVGMEGGLELLDGCLLASAWMVIQNRAGRRGEARTPTLPLPPGIQSLVEGGMELGEANDRVFATVNSKQAGGAFGLLTEGRMTRGGIYTQALELALIPLVHKLWKDPG